MFASCSFCTDNRLLAGLGFLLNRGLFAQFKTRLFSGNHCEQTDLCRVETFSKGIAALTDNHDRTQR